MTVVFLDAGYFYRSGGGGSLYNWDPSLTQFERFIDRKLAQGCHIVEINVHDIWREGVPCDSRLD
jgi:hypothetical protein